MKRAFVIGLDGFEPSIVDALLAAGELPHLARLRTKGGYARVRTTTPAQTPVAWSTVAVGRNPGGHGIFDFLRRDPETNGPDVALFRYEQARSFLPPRAINLRRGTPVWEVLGDSGIATMVLRHPCTYPPDRIRGRMLSGVGVPDIRGGFGTGTVYTAGPDTAAGEGERIVRVAADADGTIRTFLIGPPRAGGGEARVELEIVPEGGRGVATLTIGSRSDRVEVREGRWSDWVSVRFKLGALQSVHGEVRFFLVRARAPTMLYASPVNFDPLAPPFPISHPWDYAGELRREIGPFHTLGMAEDHAALNNGRIGEDAFLAQCEDVMRDRREMMRYELDRFSDGLFFIVFDTPDRLQHMFWRFREPDHPANTAHGFQPEFARVIEDHYRECDAVVGDVMQYADEQTLVIVVSDHGFRGFRRAVHLNAWLREQGLLVLRPGAAPGNEAENGAEAIDWSRTRAYALGLAGIYLNLRGREAQGILDPGDADRLKAKLCVQLSGLRDAERGGVAITSVQPRETVYRGPYVETAPDLLVNCGSGYRIASDTALGRVGDVVLSDNQKRWSGDHVMDPDLVPGVLLMNRPFDTSSPALTDLAPTILDALGVPRGPEMEGGSLLT